MIVGTILSFTLPSVTANAHYMRIGQVEIISGTISGEGRLRRFEVQKDSFYTIEVTGYSVPFVVDPCYIIVYDNYLLIGGKKIDNNGISASYEFRAKNDGFVYFRATTDTMCYLRVRAGSYGNTATPSVYIEMGKLGLYLLPIFITIPLYFLFSYVSYQGKKARAQQFGDGTFPEPYDGSPITIGELVDQKYIEEKSIFCWNCGTPNDLEMTFCINCGEELVTPDKK